VRRSLSLTPFDGLLLLMVLIWGSNYSVVKASLVERVQRHQRCGKRVVQVGWVALDEEQPRHHFAARL